MPGAAWKRASARGSGRRSPPPHPQRRGRARCAGGRARRGLACPRRGGKLSWEKLGAAGASPEVGTGEPSGARGGGGGAGETPEAPGALRLERAGERRGGGGGGPGGGGRAGGGGGARDSEPGGSGSGGKGGDWGAGERCLRRRMGRRGGCLLVRRGIAPPLLGFLRRGCRAPWPRERVVPGSAAAPPNSCAGFRHPLLLAPPYSILPACAGHPAWGLPGAFSPTSGGGGRTEKGVGVAGRVRTRGRDGKDGPRERDLTPGGPACLGGELRAGCGGTVPPEVQGALYPSPPAPRPSQSHVEELWNVRVHLVNAPSGGRGANPRGRGNDANPSGRSGLVPGMRPHLGLSAPVLGTEAALCSRESGRGRRGAEGGGRMEEHFEGTACR